MSFYLVSFCVQCIWSSHFLLSSISKRVSKFFFSNLKKAYIESNSLFAISCNKLLTVTFYLFESIIWRTNYRLLKYMVFTGMCYGHRYIFIHILLVETWRVCKIQWPEEDLFKRWGMFKLPCCQQLGGTWLCRLEEKGICYWCQKPGK